MADVTNILREPQQAGGQRAGVNIAALPAPLHGDATVGANVVRLLGSVSSVKTLFGADSKQAAAAAAAIGSDGGPCQFVGAEEKTFEETFQTASGQLDAENRRVTEITSVTSDGAALTVIPSSAEPPNAPADADSIAINLDTGQWAVDAGSEPAGGGAGVIIAGTRHEWGAAFAALKNEPHTIIAPSGFTGRLEDYGVLMAFREYMIDEKKMGCLALPVGADKDSDAVTDLLTAIGSERWFTVISDGYTGDATSAIAAERASNPVSGTAKQQQAPTGIRWTKGVLPIDYGPEIDPTAGTWHALGVNAIFRDETGVYRYSNDRALVAYGDFYKFWSTKRSEDRIAFEVNRDLLSERRKSGLAFPFTSTGLAAVRGIIEGVMARLAQSRIVDPVFTRVVMPPLDSIEALDRANRHVPNIEITFRLQGQIHILTITLGVNI